ncbi:MAG: HisS family protein [Dehalococcoidia bacterium]|nr:HisS family protein [Dehalococcoidia bacterium]
MRIQKSRGTRDLLPEEMRRFRIIEGAFRDICLKWGYQEIRTPTIEYLHLFTSTGTLTPGTLSKVYSFLDWDGWSGERVVLRPDGTIPVARLYIDNLSKEKLARLFYVTNIFSFEETGKEDREKWQCGAELIGAGSPTADIELLTIALETLKNLGVREPKLKLSHAGLIRALLAGFGLSVEEQGKVFDQILDGDMAVLAQLKDEKPDLLHLLNPLLELKGESSGFLKNLKAVFDRTLPEFTPALDNFISVTDTLTAMGQKYEIDIGSGRGFEYYTGVIFQLLARDVKVAGGGRYDALIPLLGGKNIPASGFALYVDKLMNLVKPPRSVAEKFIVTVQDEHPKTVKAAFDAITRLHNAGYIASLKSDDGPTTGITWRLEIRSKQPRFTLISPAGKGRHEDTSIEAVLKHLGGRGEY